MFPLTLFGWIKEKVFAFNDFGDSTRADGRYAQFKSILIKEDLNLVSPNVAVLFTKLSDELSGSPISRHLSDSLGTSLLGNQ